MFCNKCGNRLPEDAVFCDMCGNKIIIEAPAPQYNAQSNIQGGPNASIGPNAPGAPVTPPVPLNPYEQAQQQAPYYPVQPSAQGPIMPAAGYAGPYDGAKKGKKKGLLVALIVSTVVVVAAAALIVAYILNRGDNTDYIAAVSAHQPFKSDGYSSEYGMVFEEYIRGLNYDERKEGDIVYVDVSGTLKGTGEKIAITIEVTSDKRVAPRSVSIDGVRSGSRSEAADFLLLMFDAYDKGLNTLDFGGSDSPSGDSGGTISSPPPKPSPGASSPPSSGGGSPPPGNPPTVTPPASPSPTPTPTSEPPPSPMETPYRSNTDILIDVIIYSYKMCWLAIYWDNGTTTVFERDPYTLEWIMYSRDGSVREVLPSFDFYGNVFLIAFPTTDRIYLIFSDGTGYFGEETFTWYFEYYD